MRKSAVGGFLAGATFMYFADPRRGKRRRAIIRDRLIAGWHDVTNELDKAGRDIRNRSHGFASTVRSVGKGHDAEGHVLVDRVRASVGRAVSHPHAIKASAEENGRIILEGPVLRRELDYLIESVESVPGVREVNNRLEVHDEPGGISSLQGGVPRRHLPEVAQQNWTPALRVASAAAGGAAIYAGARSEGPLRWLGTAGGAALLARAIVNRPFREIFGVGDGAGAIDFEKAIHIHAPVEEVYAFWSNFENFPRFMTHLKEVRNLGEGRSHWVAAGPGGIPVSWNAVITEQRQNQLLAWSSVPGSHVRTSGLVRFDREPDGRTRITLRMSYSPPAGVFGHVVARLFGADPKHEIDEDLIRLKSLIEVGKTRAHGTPVTREEVRAGLGGQGRQM